MVTPSFNRKGERSQCGSFPQQFGHMVSAIGMYAVIFLLLSGSSKEEERGLELAGGGRSHGLGL